MIGPKFKVAANQCTTEKAICCCLVVSTIDGLDLEEQLAEAEKTTNQESQRLQASLQHATIVTVDSQDA